MKELTDLIEYLEYDVQAGNTAYKRMSVDRGNIDEAVLQLAKAVLAALKELKGE